MAVSKMRKLAAVTDRQDAGRLTRCLLDLECAEVESELADEEEQLSAYDNSARVSALAADALAADRALAALDRRAVRKGGLFKTRREVDFNEFENSSDIVEARALLNTTAGLLSRQGEIRAERTRLSAQCALLCCWQAYDMPLNFAYTKSTEVMLGSLPTATDADALADELSEQCAAVMTVVNSDASGIYVAVTVHNDFDDDAARLLVSHGFSRAVFGDVPAGATAVSALAAATAQIAALEAEAEKVEASLVSLAEKKGLLEIYSDYIKTEQASEAAAGRYLSSKYAVYLTAWVPAEREAEVARALDCEKVAYEFSDPSEGDNVPVLLKNNKFASPFETVVSLYSLPRYGAYDPTFVMSIFYFIIFGFMFADFGYGLLLSVVCALGIKLLRPRGGFKNFLWMFLLCGFACMAAGALLGSYFGDLPTAFMKNILGIENPPNIALWFDPLANPIIYLVASLVIGALHLLAGLALKAYILIRDGHAFDALCDVGSWYLMFAGIALAVLFPFGKYVAIAGVVMLILTQGRHEKNIIMKFMKGLLSLYGLINYAADLLSYSRIFALGLASAVIASVVNTIGTMGGATVGGIVGLILAFFIGHTLNIAINLLGTFVHTSRLQYIEFFGKFYEEGGRPFKPLLPKLKYTDKKK